MADKVPSKVFDKQLSPVKKQVALQLVKALKSQVSPLVSSAEEHAQQQVNAIRKKALAQMNESLNAEYERLFALSKINPNVRASELAFIKEQQEQLSHFIDHAMLKFEAIRLIVAGQ